jgi:hypothetical protein
LDLAGDGVELDLEVIPGHRAETEGQEIEEEGSVLGGVERDEPVVALGVGEAVDLLGLVVLPDWAGP